MTSTDEPLFDGDDAESASFGDRSDLETRIRDLLTSQPYAVLCTQSRMQPYGSLVAFAFSTDLKHVVLATPVATRKYRILSECDHVALVIDNRPDQVDDFMSVEAVTVTGQAVLLGPQTGAAEWGRALVTRHPYLESFVAAPSCALFRIDVVRFFHVTRFQEVGQWRP